MRNRLIKIIRLRNIGLIIVDWLRRMPAGRYLRCSARYSKAGISLILVVAIIWQDVAWAIPTGKIAPPGGGRYCLRARAYGEKRAAASKTEWLSVDEFVSFIKNTKVPIRKIGKDEALESIGHLDGILDDHHRGIVETGPLDLMADLNLETATSSNFGNISIVDFEYRESTFDHIFAIYKNGRVIGYGMYKVTIDYARIFSFELTILEAREKGSGYEALKFVLAMCYKRYAPRADGLISIGIPRFSSRQGPIYDDAWETQAPVFFVRAGFEPIGPQEQNVTDQIIALREGRLGKEARAALNARIFNSDLILNLFAADQKPLRIAIIGLPASGKTRAARHITYNYLKDRGLLKIGTGELLREEIEKGTPLGLSVKEYVEGGKLVPWEPTLQIIMQKILSSEAQNGFVLDGTPRSKEQAEMLDHELARHGIELSGVIHLCAPKDPDGMVFLGRIAKRREGALAKGEQPRSDDEPEIARKRIRDFRALEAGLIEYFRGQAKLVDVDSSGTVDDTAKGVERAVCEIIRRQGESAPKRLQLIDRDRVRRPVLSSI